MSEVLVSRRGMQFLSQPTSEPVDVRFDERRVWSFLPARDAGSGRSRSFVDWPGLLVPYLDGRSHVVLAGHTSRSVLFDDEVAFTDADRRVSVVDDQGHQLAIDKTGRLQREFDDTDQSVREFIIEAVDAILHDLRDKAGLDAFLAFGCLLGAVRTGRMIGHDADADVAYLSKHTHPLDIIRENRAALSVMRRLGYNIVEMSAAGFKIWLQLPGGRRCGVDVFGSYFFDGGFYMLPTVHGALDRTSLLPTSTVVLEGRELIAPAKPEDLLALTYGPSWRVPDPSFKYEHPRYLRRHMDGYWRGVRSHLRDWNGFYRSGLADRVPSEPSLFARWVDEYIGDEQTIVDAGAGTGRDASWFAGQGHHVLALDYASQARRRVRRLAARSGIDLEVDHVNFYDVRSTLLLGGRLAHDPKPRHVYARMLVDTLSASGRSEFFRFARMVSRRGGMTLLEFRIGRAVSPHALVDQITSRGGVVELREQGRDLAPLGDQNPAMCRLVVRWNR